VQATVENIDSCFRRLISNRIELYRPNKDDVIKVDSITLNPLKNHIYFDRHKELDIVDFKLIDSLISISADDTVYIASTYFMDFGSVYINIASYSSAKTFEYTIDKVNNKVDSYKIINKIPDAVYNIEQTVSKDFTDTAWSLTLGAKIIIQNDTISFGTIYYHTFSVE